MFLERLDKLGLNFRPHFADTLPRSTLLPNLKLDQLRVDHVDNIIQSDRLRPVRQSITAKLPAPTDNQAAISQVTENLRQIIRRNFLRFRKRFYMGQLLAPVVTRQLSEHPTCIFDYYRKLHTLKTYHKSLVSNSK